MAFIQLHTNISNPQSTDAFVPFQAPESPTSVYRVAYQNVVSMPQHLAYSPEELRLNDYKHKRGAPAGFQMSACKSLQLPPNGTVAARVTLSTLPARSARAPLNAGIPDDFGTSMVFFDVGKEHPKRFAIYETVITARSEFVRLALNNEWKEAKERIIPLPEDEPTVFKLYQLWIYYNRIFSAAETTPIIPEDGTEYPLLIKAYLLGEKLLDVHFKDAVIDSIIEKLRTTSTFNARLTNLVYENTPEKSPLRRLLQDIYIWSGNATWLDEQLLGDFVNGDFAVDLSRRQMSFWGGTRPDAVPYMESTCGYHEHVNGVCYQTVYY